MEDTDWAEQRLRVLFSFNKGRQTCHSIFLGNCEALNFYKKDNPLSILQEQKNGVRYTQPLFTRWLRGAQLWSRKRRIQNGKYDYETMCMCGKAIWAAWPSAGIVRTDGKYGMKKEETGGSDYLHMFRVRWSAQDNNVRGAFFCSADPSQQYWRRTGPTI